MAYRLLNPLLNAVFNNPAPSNKHRELLQSLSNHSTRYTLLIPQTSTLEWCVDKDSYLPFRDMCMQDEFILTHIVQVPESNNHDRTKYVTSVNGKRVVIHNGFVALRSSSGAKSRRAIVREYLFNPGCGGVMTTAQFVVYEIDGPLIGEPIPSKEVSATISSKYEMALASPKSQKDGGDRQGSSSSAAPLSLERLLGQRPRLNKQVTVPLRSVFENFAYEDAECVDDLVNALDNAVDLAVQVVQSADKTLIAELAVAYDLSGDDVTDMLHDHVESGVCQRLWGKLTELRRNKDLEVVEAIRKIKSVDVAQIGLPYVSSAELTRLDRLVHEAVEEFNKLKKTTSSDQKIEILLSVLKVLSGSGKGQARHVNADFLVSLLVLVICRSDVKTVDSHICYIKNFSYRDTESGQLGYALLTFEGVLFHILNETGNLEQMSQANEDLWQAVKEGRDLKKYIKKLKMDNDHWGLVIQSKREGDSCLMQAIQARHVEGLRAFLELDVIDQEFILGDRNKDGTTLLAAAVESELDGLIEPILAQLDQADDEKKREYLALEDEFQRTVAHYLFHAPHLIDRLGEYISWETRDHNGQTPLFGLCRCYDHPQYYKLVDAAFKAWGHTEAPSTFDHIDDRGNTLLHIAKDKYTVQKVLEYAPDVNWPNFKGMTPMMIFSKYSRLDAINLLSYNPLLDLDRQEIRGMTALEVAKDAQANVLLDKIYLLSIATSKTHLSAITRTMFVDNELYFIIASGVVVEEKDGKKTIQDMTTVRRTFADFVFLQKWLTYERPYSWVPALKTPRNPFSEPLQPSTQLVYEVRTRLSAFLRILRSHPAFERHELLWEFLLIQDWSKEQSKDRCRKKLEHEKEMQYSDLTVYNQGDLDLVRTFFEHAANETSTMFTALGKVAVAGMRLKVKSYDLADAYRILGEKFEQVEFFRDRYRQDMMPYYDMATAVQGRSLVAFAYDLSHTANTAHSVLASLSQPLTLVSQLEQQDQHVRQIQTALEQLNNKSTWPMGMFEEKRERDVKDAQDKIYTGQNDIRKISSDIKYAHIAAASELGGFYTVQQQELQRIVHDFARAQIRDGKERLMRLQRLHQSFTKR